MLHSISKKNFEEWELGAIVAVEQAVKAMKAPKRRKVIPEE